MAIRSEYERTTEGTTLDRLPEALRTAIELHLRERSLTVASDARAFLTHSRRTVKPGLWRRMTGTADRDAEHWTATVIGARDVIVANHGETRGTPALSARLTDVDVEILAERFAAAGLDVPEDGGVSLTGFATSIEGEPRRGSLYVGLGPPDGEMARAALHEAVRQAKAA